MADEKKKAAGIIKKIFGFAAAAVMVLFFVLFIMTKFSGSPVFLFGRTTMWVMTESMSGTIEPRTYILVRSATADDVRVADEEYEGDIIVFISDDPRIAGSLNTHRAIAKKANGDFVTKGDNNLSDDGEYSAKAANVVGIYERTLPVMTFLGRVVLAPVGFMIIMILFVAVTAICVLPDIKNAVRSTEDDAAEKKKKEMDRLVREEVLRLEREGVNATDLSEEGKNAEGGGDDE